jgi:hypothetical protein
MAFLQGLGFSEAGFNPRFALLICIDHSPPTFPQFVSFLKKKDAPGGLHLRVKGSAFPNLKSNPDA